MIEREEFERSVEKGDLIELFLVEGAQLDVESSNVPLWYVPNDRGDIGNIRGLGYFAGITDGNVTLVPNWDKSTNWLPEAGWANVGSINYSFDSIGGYEAIQT